MKINELIKELCPNGVEWKNTIDLSEKCFWLMPSTPSFIDKGVPYITSKNIKDGCIIFDNVSYISKEVYAELSKNRAIQRGDLLITMIGTIGEAAFVSEDIDFYGQNLYLVRLNKEKINPNYFFYYFQTQKGKIISKKNPAGQGYIKAESINSLKIPLPPLAIQSRIVEILDHFTNLTANLTAELNLRRKQFEHYREKLLAFDGVEGVEWKTLGEVAEMKRGNNVLKTDFVNEGIGCIHYGQIYTHYDLYATKTNKFISKEVAIKAPKARKNDVVITITSENVDDLCKPVAWLGEEDIAVSSHALILRHNQNAKFLSLLFISENVRKQKAKFAHSGKVTEIIPEHVGRIVIPIPPLATQHSIVSILDKFTALIENIEKELALRQKQYEYYREELLRFGS